MVLQSNQKVPVLGGTAPYATVEVLFAGQKKHVKADALGKWKVNLDSLKASSVSQTLIISSQANGARTQLKIRDVLVGEVWHKDIPNPVEVRYAWSSN